MFFIKKMIETYLAWSNGDPETSPFRVLLGFIEALIIMISFGFLYKYFVIIFKKLYDSMSTAAFNVTDTQLKAAMMNLSGLNFINVFGTFIYLIITIIDVLIYFQNIQRGFEILVLRFGIPFACIGLLNADGGVFKGYIQKFIKCAFTVIVQMMLLKLSLVLLANYRLVLSLACALLAKSSPQLLNEFLATPSQGRGVGGAAGRVGMIAGMMLKGRKIGG